MCKKKNATPTALEFKNSLRVLTIAQYLKGCDSGSYELDEGSFIADFLDTQNVQSVSADDVSNRRVCEPLIVSSQSESAVSDIIDLKCLYYLGAYVASCVKNTMHSVNSA